MAKTKEMKPIVTVMRENAEDQLHALRMELIQAQLDKGLTTAEPDLLIARIASLGDLINILEASEKELK